MIDEDDRREFGEFLRQLRQSKEFSQKDTAAQSGVSSAYLAQLERGQRNPPSRKIMSRLAEVYGVTLQELLGKAYGAEQQSKQNAPRLSAERVNWAFETMCRDPDYNYGTRLRNQKMTLEAKALLVEIYQRSMGRQLLNQSEVEVLQTGKEITDDTNNADVPPSV